MSICTVPASDIAAIVGSFSRYAGEPSDAAHLDHLCAVLATVNAEAVAEKYSITVERANITRAQVSAARLSPVAPDALSHLISFYDAQCSERRDWATHPIASALKGMLQFIASPAMAEAREQAARDRIAEVAAAREAKHAAVEARPAAGGPLYAVTVKATGERRMMTLAEIAELHRPKVRVLWNGFKGIDGKLQPARFSFSRDYRDGKGVLVEPAHFTVYHRDHCGDFGADVCALFVVENGTDTQSDYFESDRMRVRLSHPLVREIAAAACARLEHDAKGLDRQAAKGPRYAHCIEQAARYRAEIAEILAVIPAK